MHLEILVLRKIRKNRKVVKIKLKKYFIIKMLLWIRIPTKCQLIILRRSNLLLYRKIDCNPVLVPNCLIILLKFWMAKTKSNKSFWTHQLFNRLLKFHRNFINLKNKFSIIYMNTKNISRKKNKNNMMIMKTPWFRSFYSTKNYMKKTQNTLF